MTLRAANLIFAYLIPEAVKSCFGVSAAAVTPLNKLNKCVTKSIIISNEIKHRIRRAILRSLHGLEKELSACMYINHLFHFTSVGRWDLVLRLKRRSIWKEV